jgi:predicted MFS family arabinose efflux permease
VTIAAGPVVAGGGRLRWLVVAALGVQQVLAWGATYYLLSVLTPAIAADTGWQLPLVVGALSGALLAGAGVAPLVGRWIARHGGRNVLCMGSAIIAAGLALVAVAPVLWVYLAAWLLIGVGMACALYDPAFSTLAQLYGSDARRSITALTLIGGFSITVCWPASGLLLAHFGWRGTAAAYALANLAICLPLIRLGLPDPPRAPLPPGRAALQLAGRERLMFRLLALLQTLSGGATTMVSIHLLTMLQAIGLSTAQAVALGAMIGPSQVASRLVEMAGGGRHHPVWTLLAALAFSCTGLWLLAATGAPAAVALCLFGAGAGLMSIARGAVPLALFGPERYPAVMGRLARPSMIAQASAPLGGGVLLSAIGAPAMLLAIALALTCALGLVAALMALRPR